ncbi:MAG: extracellular solute-binding protein [Tenericutes bacterium]|nr:extracellular solute-binding protein [Mycoplasmatota bacterium]
MKKFFLVTLLILNFFIIAMFRITTVLSKTLPDTSTVLEADDSFNLSDFRNNTYYRRLNQWLEEFNLISKVEERISISDFQGSNPDITFFVDSQYHSTKVVALNEDETLSFDVIVDSEGLYELGIDFLIPDEFYTIPTISITVNGESQYNELAELELEVLWEIKELPEDARYNRYGNELLPTSESVIAWSKYYFDDYNSYVSDNYKFLLHEGVNEISITNLSIPMYIGDAYIKGQTDLIDYSEYSNQDNAAITSTTSSSFIQIEGESFVYKNDLEVKSSYYKESAMTPYSYKNTVLNQLDGSSSSRGGTLATYEFEVAVSGFFNMSFKAMHDTNLGIAAAKNIYIDGEIPFSELEGYLFPTSKKYSNVTLGNDSGAFFFYLESGTHTLTIESTVAPYMSYVDELNEIMDSISAISLEVQTITGGNNTDTLDWNILKYIPDLEEQLLAYATRLEEIYIIIDDLDTGSDNVGEATTLNVAAKQLRRIARTPNKIGSKLTEFSEGSGSAYQLIGNAVSYLISEPLSVDCIYLSNNVELPDPNGSFFRKVWDGIRSFFYSFFDTRYNDNDVDEDTLEVWVGQSNLYLDIIQSMIDQGFSADTGVSVKCSIMNNTQKVVLSNATNDNPDVVLSIDSWVPYAYALRGMLEDMSKLEGFDEVATNYYANNFTPVIFEDGVYAIPETQSVFLLFYRKDIMEYLDLEVPDTWDDVIDMLPILQSHQMNFYHPLGGDTSYKGFGFTSPFIYQFGGEIYTENGVYSTLMDSDTIRAVEFMTDLFTIYDLPLQVSSFFEHFRSGDMPIGISTIDLYLQLQYAAPELSGQWGVAVLPGTYNADSDTVERWSPTYGKTSILFSNSNMTEEAWALIKWWNSTETQIKYMQNIKTSLGEKYLLISANMNAMKQSVWNEGVKDTIAEQAMWSRLPAVTPGSYIVERELSNIWNKVVIDQDNVLVAINESIPRIIRELSRKNDEFGYLSVNNPDGIPYIVPMDENISTWIKEEYGDD